MCALLCKKIVTFPLSDSAAYDGMYVWMYGWNGMYRNGVQLHYGTCHKFVELSTRCDSNMSLFFIYQAYSFH